MCRRVIFTARHPDSEANKSEQGGPEYDNTSERDASLLSYIR